MIRSLKILKISMKEGVKKFTSLRIIGFGFLSNSANVFKDAY